MVVFCERMHGDVIRIVFARKATLKKESNMKKEYDLRQLKRRPGKVKVDPEAAKVPVSLRLDGAVIAFFKSESERLGMPYQTLIGSILHQYSTGELVEKKMIALLKEVGAS